MIVTEFQCWILRKLFNLFLFNLRKKKLLTFLNKSLVIRLSSVMTVIKKFK
jgi:hypothetical protein